MSGRTTGLRAIGPRIARGSSGHSLAEAGPVRPTDRALRGVDHDGQLPDRVRSPTEVYLVRWVPRAGTSVEAADDAANDEVEHKRTDNEGEENGDDQYDIDADAVSDGFVGVHGDSG
ncbi:hypothetical protein IEQ34_019986 [Dendrobium chrysotoxum]|uniref:Uncharacterized protein n=1 Tax=Dendrobium chrysotoxum TaxID=161865 RepID=A0AAV7GAW8_DENCH|nr:hypothetical protein IEQ34_019986 [Dendrobium chrysotoxum]